MAITSHDMAGAFARIASAAAGFRDELCAADARLGDGDLGLTVADGFAEVARADLPEDVGLAFLEAAKAFQRASSSSFGTLVATGFMSAVKALKGRTSFDAGEVGGLLAGAVQAMLARGKSQLGDKTVLDGLDAQAKAVSAASGDAVLAAAIAAARDCLARFTPQENRIGRARMFGAKSAGLPDPGQLALLRITEAIA